MCLNRDIGLHSLYFGEWRTKIFESAIKVQIMQYFQYHSIITPHQSAYLHGMSTQTALHSVIDTLSSNMNDGSVSAFVLWIWPKALTPFHIDFYYINSAIMGLITRRSLGSSLTYQEEHKLSKESILSHLSYPSQLESLKGLFLGPFY